MCCFYFFTKKSVPRASGGDPHHAGIIEFEVICSPRKRG